MKKPWFHILLSLASADRYGSAIEEDVRALSGGAVRLWPATLYGALEELVEKGWIRELDEAERPGEGGRERFYTLLPPGREALAAETDRREALVRAARERLSGEAR